MVCLYCYSAIVHKFDKDGDQSISFEEFVTRLTSLPGEEERLTLDDRMWTHLQQEFNKVCRSRITFIQPIHPS
jgi:hypothetical protein